jgi:hypothetical protein
MQRKNRRTRARRDQRLFPPPALTPGLKEAESRLAQAAKLDPGNAYVWQRLGRARLDQTAAATGSPREAIRALCQAVRLERPERQRELQEHKDFLTAALQLAAARDDTATNARPNSPRATKMSTANRPAGAARLRASVVHKERDLPRAARPSMHSAPSRRLRPYRCRRVRSRPARQAPPVARPRGGRQCLVVGLNILRMVASS